MTSKIHEGMAGDSIEIESDGVLEVKSGGRINIESGGKFEVAGVDKAASIAGLPATTNYAVGVASGYKIARGVHLQIAAKDTVATSLTTVVAVTVSPIQAPTAKQAFASASIGNQAGLPAAGSVYIETWKSTYAAADDFTDSLSFAWVAVGT
jgi:hypothetical protein